ncbi:MAG: helix-turn-helix transcriptional regulator [Chloroflexota bacterium]
MNTGKDLTLKRIAMDVPAGALAERIGVSGSTLSRWENSRRVTTKAADRYLAALATFGTIPTVDVSVPEQVA